MTVVAILSVTLLLTGPFTDGSSANDHLEAAEPRIINGSTVNIDNYPFMAQVYRENLSNGSFGRCGGTFIRTRIVLTAAHCVYGFDSSVEQIVIQYGRSRIFTGPTRLAMRVEVHPDYEEFETGRPNSPYDIALIVLDAPVEASRVVRLATEGEAYAADEAYVVG